MLRRYLIWHDRRFQDRPGFPYQRLGSCKRASLAMETGLRQSDRAVYDLSCTSLQSASHKCNFVVLVLGKGTRRPKHIPWSTDQAEVLVALRIERSMNGMTGAAS